MDFHLATPEGDVYLFSAEDGRAFLVPPAPAARPAEQVPEPPPPPAHR